MADEAQGEITVDEAGNVTIGAPTAIAIFEAPPEPEETC